MSAPTPFGKYQLIDRISIGGMAEVFRAKLQNDRTERLFAIKKILPSLCEDANFIKMFVEEARLAGQLVHPNICAIHELGRADGAHFLAMEYIWGKDLIQVRTKLRKAKQKVPLEVCVFILARVLEGLDYAHKKRDPLGRMLGLVHRDLSPHNVLISYDGDVKVIDFGIAKADSRASMTQAGTLKGKFAYMSPEQVQGGKLDRRSDIFALGTLFFELVTGERLFFGESDFNTLERVRKVEVKPPRDIDPTIPEGVEAIIYKALAKEVENRYQWCSEMRADLEPFIAVDQPVVAAWMHQLFAAEIPVEREQIEFGLANGRARPTPSSTTPIPDVPKVAIPAPASLPPRRGGPIVVEDQRSRSGSAGSRPGQHVHVEDNRSKTGGIRAASSVHVEDNRSKPGGFRPPSSPVAPVEREPSLPNETPKPRRVSAPMEVVPPPPAVPTPAPPAAFIPAPTIPEPPIVAAPAARAAPRRTKAPSVGDEFNDEPPTQSSAPSFESDWVEPQQPMDWSEALELSDAGTQRPKWSDPPPPTQTARDRPSRFTDKIATEPVWTDHDTAWNDQQWSDAEITAPPSIVELEPPVDTLDLPADPGLDFLDLDARTESVVPHVDELLDLNVEVASADDEPLPPPDPEPEPPAPGPTNRVLRLGGRKFRPNR